MLSSLRHAVPKHVKAHVRPSQANASAVHWVQYVYANGQCIHTTRKLLYGTSLRPGADLGGVIGAIASPKANESNFFHCDFVQFGKQHFRYKAPSDPRCFVTAVLWSILHVPYNSELVMRLDCKISLKSPTPLNLLAGPAPDSGRAKLRKWSPLHS